MQLEEVTIISYGNRNYNVVLDFADADALPIYDSPQREARIRDFLVRLMEHENVPMHCLDAIGADLELPDFITAIFKVVDAGPVVHELPMPVWA